MCLCVYLVRHQGWPRSSLHMSPLSQVEWHATLRTLFGFQTLLPLFQHLQDICRASDWSLVDLGNISGKLDIETGWVNEDTDEEKDGERIFSVLNLFQVMRSLLLLINSCKTFVSRWIITSHFIYDMYRTGKGNRKSCVGGNGGFFGCFVS